MKLGHIIEDLERRQGSEVGDEIHSLSGELIRELVRGV